MHWVDGSPIAGSKDYHIIEHCGHRIGFIGLAEDEWIDCLPEYDPSDLVFEDPSDLGDELAEQLKSKHGCSLVVALTHMRVPND